MVKDLAQLKEQHEGNLINIYEKFLKQALDGDVQSARFLVDFSKQFFADDTEGELSSLLNNIKLGSDK